MELARLTAIPGNDRYFSCPREIAVTSRNRPHSYEFDGSTPLRHKTVLIRANLRIETMGIADRPDIARAIDGLGVIRSVVLFTAKAGDDGLVGEVIVEHDEIFGFRGFCGEEDLVMARE